MSELNLMKTHKRFYAAAVAMEMTLSLPKQEKIMVKLRVSFENGCGYCIRMSNSTSGRTGSTPSVTELLDARAWLTVITSRLALDTATSAARSRTDYLGPWLPEIVVLDEPCPEDRAVLVLADVFDVPFRDIARVLGSTPAATRQKASRARKHLARAAESSVATAADLAGLAHALEAAVGGAVTRAESVDQVRMVVVEISGVQIQRNLAKVRRY